MPRTPRSPPAHAALPHVPPGPESSRGPRRAPVRLLRGLTALATGAALGCADATGPGDGPCDGVIRRGTTVVSPALAPGDMCALPMDDLLSVEIPPGDATAQYLIAVQSGLRAPGASTRLRLTARGRGASAARVPPLAAAPPPLTAEALGLEAVSAAELTLRRSARLALRGARPLYAPRGGSPVPLERTTRARPTAAPRSAGVGDTVVFHNAVHPDLSVDCDGIHDVTAIVRAVGRRFAIAEDVDGSGAMDGGAFARVMYGLENIVYPVVTSYFGEPGDIDGNGVVWVLFTPVVNRATPRSGRTRISGFFNPADLAHPESCAASNGGEVLWLLTADPGGRYSKPVPAEIAATGAVGVAAHELEHLIAAERRTVLGGGTFADLEDVWLSEGLAHSAETFVGMWLERLRPGRNYGFEELASDTETFRTYHFSNLRRAAFHLSNPHRTPALGDDDGGDPSGIPSLAMRGYWWLFLRWFADQYATGAGGFLGGPAEEGIFHDLAGGGPGRARGVENLERVAAARGAPGEWEALLSAWALSPLADDLAGNVPTSTQVKSLDLRDAFAELHHALNAAEPFAHPHPLFATEVGLASDTDVRVEFELNAATARYFVLEGGGPHPALHVRLAKLGGGHPSGAGGVRLVILRTR